MKQYLKYFILFFLGSTYLTAQNEKVDYDKCIPKYIYSIWEPSDISNNNFGDIHSVIILDQIKSFFSVQTEKNDNIASFKFLKNPTDNTLVAHYLNTKLKWNRFNKGKNQLTVRNVIGEALLNLPDRYELLAFYYNTIFSHLRNNQNEMNLGKIDINLDSLELSNNTEKVIVFLCSMRHLGSQISSYSSGENFPANCFRAKRLVSNMPTFNGKTFYEFELPEFKDFMIKVDKRLVKVSFKNYYLPLFHEAKARYIDCLNAG